MPKTEEVKTEMEVAQITLATGEIVETISTEKFREMSQAQQADALVRVKRLADFFRKLFNDWEPILRTRMDFARTDSTEINQVKTGDATVHLGAGKEDKALSQAEIEAMWAEWLEIDPAGAKACFEDIHKVKKAEVSKYRKQKGEPGSMERKRSELIERYYVPQPKKLEIKGA